MSADQLEDERIAIIGMAGRFPGARNVAELWQNLRDGVESIRRFDDDELRARGVPDDLLSDPSYVKAGTVLDDVEMFDAAFFGLSPREAALMDPQQRLFLQACYAALEDAGYNSDAGPLAAGVFAGSGYSGYLGGPDLRPGSDQALELVRMLGNEKDYLASRVAYHLNLTGPALVVQSTCATSLVAIHLACQNLLTYQCDLALAGGVSILLPQGVGYLHQEGMLRSPDGHCRAFDARAAGYVDGRGLGVVVLKRLSEALEDGDRIDAVILGSAVNNDGSLKVGFTALSVEGQAQVVASALAMAGVEPETIRYVEAFGSGTPLGDTIEVAALTRAFRAQTGARGFCRIGSIKTNIGHLDTAAGVAGLIKAALVLKTGEVPPSLHFETPNPEIDLASTPFAVAGELTRLQSGPEPLRAGVSSFGVGGTNAHVILEEPPVAEEPADRSDRPALIVLSAKTRQALGEAGVRLAEHLRAAPAISLEDAAWTLQVGRRHFDHRRMLVASDLPAVVAELNRPWTAPVAVRGDREVVFLLPGEPLPDRAPARDLYRREPVFRDAFDRCATVARRAEGPDLVRALRAEAHDEDPLLRELLLFALEHALATFWMAAGIRPEAMLGQGTGLLAAACLADMVSLDEALGLIWSEARSLGTAVTADDLERRIRTLPLRPAKIPVVSATHGGPLTGSQSGDPVATIAHLAETEALDAALEVVLGRSGRVLLEVGPAETLARRVRPRAAGAGDALLLASLPRAGQEIDAASHIRAVFGQLWLAGLKPDFRILHHGRRPRRVGLPTYPFARTPHWVEAERAAPASRGLSLPDEQPSASGAGASRDHTERTLASIFAAVLGVREVGVQDNFLHLGGDSLMALSVAARARDVGLHISAHQIMATPTVAALAEIATHDGRAGGASTPVAGELPITPFLARFLQERGEHDPHRWNISGLAECRRRMEPELLERTLAVLVGRHDSLRLRVVRGERGWAAEIRPAAQARPGFAVVDLSDLADEALAAAISAHADEAQRGLHLADGPILQVVLFELGPERPQRLLLVVHHFALDGFAWLVLLHEFERTYASLERGDEPAPGPDAGMKVWAEDLQNFARDQARRAEIEAWLALPWSAVRPLPLDHPGDHARNTNASAAGVALELSRAETERLLRSTTRGFSPETLMLTALARALARFKASRHVLIERLFQGRNVTGSRLDLAASLGSFLCYAPCLIEVEPDAPVLDLVRSVREQMQTVAGRGAAIDMVRFMAPEQPRAGALVRLPRAEVLFNYRGRVDGLFEQSELFAPAREPAGSDYDPACRRYYPLAVRADLVAGKLDLRVVYSRNLHERSTVQALADDFMSFIRAAIGRVDEHHPSS